MERDKAPATRLHRVLMSLVLFRAKLRSWTDTFKVSAFSVPKRDELKHRVAANVQHYQSNYFLLLFVCLFVVCTRAYIFFVLVPLMIGGYLLLGSHSGPITIAKNTLPKAHALLSYAVLCALVSLIFGGFTFVAWVLLAFVLSAAHAFFRQPAPMVGLSSGGGTSFGDDDGSDEEDPGRSAAAAAASGDGAGSDQQFRAQFRAKMRSKYLKK